ncbi:nucleolar protein 14 [Trichonephila inaurata madagascariensis]|uniref:Nucleolar protein 14 n=1 Tax=Trichonephila inaurata madagascariensis TaxID=2747483 RepID=A0A8X6X6A0_9ARAC|nr:nucleolar protein 14 [Trichonephila inaurata madagascariensis]
MVKQVIKKNKNFKGEGNPFNFKLNRAKRTVLGKDPIGTKGLRCISRAESHMKRKELYNKSKKTASKANNFVDRRFLHETAEDSILARFVKERKKRLKKNIFNLNEEDLTHKGVPLHLAGDLDEKPVSDDEQLDAAFVSKAHFAGFSAKDEENLSHKEIIDQFILQSKEKKQEQKMEKELVKDKNESLQATDTESMEIRNKEDARPEIQTDKNESLQATNKEEPMQITDTESMEIRNKEDARPEIQVIINSIQMQPDKPKQVPDKKRAFDIYKNILLLTPRGTAIGPVKTVEELEKEEQEKQLKLEKERHLRMADDKEMKAKSVDHMSAGLKQLRCNLDLQTSVTGRLYSYEKKKVISNEESEYSDSDESVDSEMSDHMIEDKDNSYVKSLKSECDDKAFNIPANMDEFEEFLEANKCVSPEEKLETIGKILKPCHDAQSEKRLNKLAAFFGILIEYSLKHFKNNPTISENIVPHLFDIIKVTSLKSSEKILSLLDQEKELFQNCKAKKKKRNSPKLKVVLLLKYCSVLYSVSDFTHPVITPAILFMCDILASDFFISFQNIESRLCICSIILDCVTLSKRLVPEAVCFLNKLLKLTFPFKNESLKKATGSEINLIISEKQICNEINDINYLKPDESSSFNSRKLSIILKTVNLLQKFSALYQYLPSFTYLFKESLINCAQLPIEYYPDILKNSVSQLVQEIKKNDNKLLPLTFPKVKPKPLELFEPLYESKFCEIDNINKRLKILKNVQQKIRKEKKDMVREMRRDVQVVASEKLKEELQADAERKRKVKELYHDIACERGDYKKMLASMK